MSEHIHTHGRTSVDGPIMRCPRCGPLEDTIARLRESYELKVADLAKETARVEILAKVLREDNHSPDGFHAEGDRCRHCKALREALRPDGEATP